MRERSALRLPIWSDVVLRAHPQILAIIPAFVFSIPTTRRWPFHTREGVAYADIAPRVITDSSETALRLALDGVGLARLGDVIVGEPIRRGLLVPVLTDVHYAEPVSLSALYLAGRHRLPKVRVFLDFLTERLPVLLGVSQPLVARREEMCNGRVGSRADEIELRQTLTLNPQQRTECCAAAKRRSVPTDVALFLVSRPRSLKPYAGSAPDRSQVTSGRGPPTRVFRWFGAGADRCPALR